MTCDKCTKNNEKYCVQYLGEAIGWQWWEKTDNSWKDCHKNYLLNNKEFINENS